MHEQDAEPDYRRECLVLETKVEILSSGVKILSLIGMGQNSQLDAYLQSLRALLEKGDLLTLDKAFNTINKAFREHLDKSLNEDDEKKLKRLIETVSALSKLASLHEKMEAIETLALDGNDDETLSKICSLLSEIYKALSEKVAHQSITFHEIDISDKGQRLLRLLKVPDELEEDYGILKQQLLAPLHINKVVDVFGALLSLTEKSVFLEREEVKAFLKKLSGKFGEIGVTLTDAVNKQDNVVENSQLLQENIEQNVSLISDGFKEETDILKLAPKIECYLDSINKAMISHQQEEKVLSKKIQDELETLKNQINILKRESEVLKGNLRESEQMANTDKLTLLKNRRAFDLFIEQCQEDTSIKRYFVIIDIDKFKLVNDTYGHLVGDSVLKFSADLIKEINPNLASIFRLGGEEFMMVFENTDLETVKRRCETLRLAFCDRKIPVHDHEPIAVTISIGISEFNGVRGAVWAMEKADTALYYSKENGRNQITVDKEST